MVASDAAVETGLPPNVLMVKPALAYLDMYEDMIGPYPYGKFATVENWFPTGYGMPGWTLLGSQVLRLPFIPYISFGHEIAHNWWGNSVFVDISEGNWCEGLTVYCADYHYKELESDHEATQYRRRLLKDYAAYVKDPSLDFPLSEFLSRHSGATRAVGYGKSMMVFHMIDRMIGREAFEAAGYRDAFQVRLLPEGADPMDVRYNVIQWVHRSTRGWSYGASVVELSYDTRQPQAGLLDFLQDAVGASDRMPSITVNSRAMIVSRNSSAPSMWRKARNPRSMK